MCEEARTQTDRGPGLPPPQRCSARSIENKYSTARPRGRSTACVCGASSLIIESGSLSVALSPEETAGGVAGSATSTVYTIMAIKLRGEAQHNIGGQLAWSRRM